jgi:hypothetical protein
MRMDQLDQLELLDLLEAEAKKTGKFDDPDWRERAKAVYRGEGNNVEDFGELNVEEQRVFLELLIREVGQQGVIEDVGLGKRLKAAHTRSQTTETEISLIENNGELAIFLDLIEEQASQSGYLSDNSWLARAKASYISDRNKKLTQQLNLIDEAIKDITQGCDLVQQSTTQPETEINVGEAIAQLIRGSHYLLTLTEYYLNPPRNWLQRRLYKQVEFLDFPKFRLEERIKSIRYIIDYLERSLGDIQNDLQTCRLDCYLKTLPVEACHLAEWLKGRVGNKGALPQL